MIDVRNATKRFRTVTAVDGVSLRVEPGQVVPARLVLGEVAPVTIATGFGLRRDAALAAARDEVIPS